MRFVCSLALCAACALAVASAGASDTAKDSLVIERPWSRATPPGATVAAGYLVIENRGSAPDRLVSVTSEIGTRAEVHEMTLEGGVMRMRPLPRGLEIAPGTSARLEPGGYHLMFHGLERPLVAGERFKATLTFERAGAIEVEFLVEAMGGGPQRHGH